MRLVTSGESRRLRSGDDAAVGSADLPRKALLHIVMQLRIGDQFRRLLFAAELGWSEGGKIPLSLGLLGVARRPEE